MSERLSGEHGLSFYSVQSFFVHLSLVFLALIIGKLSWDKVQDIRNENIQLVQNSVRVDMVAMPELTIKELKTYEEPVSEPAPAEEVVKKEEPPVVADQPEFVEEKKKQDFASMLKNLSQKKVEEKAAKKEKKKDSFDTSKINKLVAAGNKLSAGAALVGGEGSAAQGEYARYLGTIPEAIKPFWKLPSYLASQDLKARVRIFIKEDGTLIKAQLYESSGNEEYDQRAIDSVEKARFGRIPQGFAAKGLAGEIVLGFPL
ncbi:MAG: hypothetical protein COW01_08470 [Bdellovibrionales bacterium CG12_big_fil_rev_8_21_14_0_65_38_15]|nr:MAG: hypothetical protein COW79_15405 [Bdellovibrionales bacterium CG22_combo_CG10-13_8_21_14_all_38_13]PIQ55163.1 MAG: hypothetical protein COW01_08470 [Bdellovibrionales bacterium CG12_big_fil_rev_8_21_14_0_65_38_15]PIR29211.1 MAG: hypothetical protein COV38_11785 [Bdellovibrionales bacterium CG11_big_fil_rev_8_21_14_0_20_38_13]